SPFAYVFYATSASHACAALLLIHTLSLTSPNIPTILLAPPRPQLNPKHLAPFARYNTTILRFPPPVLASGANPYYKQVLLKLMAFKLNSHFPHLKRVIVMDADQTLLKPRALHDLFRLELSPGVDIAAPTAYWFGSDSDTSHNVPGYITTALMLIQLSDELWEEVDAGMNAIQSGEYDMDLINRLFYTTKRIHVLPGSYCTLNSHWDGKDKSGPPSWMKNPSAGLEGLWNTEAVLIHYSSVGKPWDVTERQLAHSHKDADPQLPKMFKQWVGEAKGLCAPGW
ncbi:nucleotide-diphospho-sugar transferase, partial [Coprinopsis marcescibilis]